jgi:hypothetical protein
MGQPEVIYGEQSRALNGLAGAVFGTVAFSDEATVPVPTGVLSKNSPVFPSADLVHLPRMEHS